MKQTILVALLLVSFVGQGWADETKDKTVANQANYQAFTSGLQSE